ncbi:MAG: acyl-CoA thioesterase [Bdellovibrionaceae bacterium]|nr:acyl-CoA thioesterase [Pseudobdellovibrionaceae bacterium]
MSQVFEYPVQIREFHLDTFGHVNNAAYLSIFEEARWDLITKNGYGLKQVHEFKKGPVILEVNLKFQKELRLRETITVTTTMESYQGKIFVLLQKMLNAKGDVCCEARFTGGLFDLQERKLITATPEWMKAVGL